MTIHSLWGSLPVVPEGRTPRVILTEQAEALSEGTNRVLRGEVSSYAQNKSVVNELSIVAPALSNYRITILSTTNTVTEVYPVQVTDLTITTPDISYGARGAGTNYPPLVVCQNETELETTLKTILQAPHVHGIIAGLLAQSTQYTPAF